MVEVINTETEQQETTQPENAAQDQAEKVKRRRKRGKKPSGKNKAPPGQIPSPGGDSSTEVPQETMPQPAPPSAKKRPNRRKHRKARTGIEQLPMNILRLIAENISYYGGSQRDAALASEHDEDPRIPSAVGLMSLRLCNRRLNKAATPVLFRRIKLHSNIEEASNQALGLSQSSVSRYVRRLILSTACAMPRGLPEAYYHRHNRSLERHADFQTHEAKQLFAMRWPDTSTFPLLMLALFNSVCWGLTTLKVHVADVVPISYDQEYSTLFIRTLSFALRTIEMPVLRNVQFTHPQLFQELDMIREIKPLAQIPPAHATFPRSLTSQIWRSSHDNPALEKMRSLRFAINNPNGSLTDKNLNLATLLTTSLKGLALRMEDLSISLGIAFRITNIIIRPCESIRSLKLTGYINVPRSTIIKDAIDHCVNLEYLHLRGVCISATTGGEDVTWTHVFDACAAKQSLVSVRFELLSHLNHFSGPHVATLYRVTDLPAPKVGNLDLWIDEQKIWRPLVTKQAAELESLEKMRVAITERRKERGLKPTRWLEKCGLEECKKILTVEKKENA